MFGLLPLWLWRARHGVVAGRCEVILLSALCFLLCPTLQAASYTCGAGQTCTLTQTINLAGTDTVDYVGTSASPCTIEGGGFQFLTPDPSWQGHFTIKNCTVHNLGTVTQDAIQVYTAGSDAIDFENVVWDGSSSISLQLYGNESALFRGNTILANAIFPAEKEAAVARAFLTEQGTSPAAKFFQSNKVFKGGISVASPNWLVGGDTDALGNIHVGKRVGISVQGSGSRVEHNYSHVLMPIDPVNWYWSQVTNLSIGAGVIAEHNVIRAANWVVNGMYGELRYNLITETDSHALTRIGNGLIHHNIYAHRNQSLPRYDPGDTGPGDTETMIQQIYDGTDPSHPTPDGFTIYNNTLDSRGIHPIGVAIPSTTFLPSLRNNVFYSFDTHFVPTGGTNAAVGANEVISDPGPPTMGYADYNLFHWSPTATTTPNNYLFTVSGKTERVSSGFALHDVVSGGPKDQSVDPQFRGPLPIGFPFSDSDIVSGAITVSQVLDYYFYVYSPAPGSPMIGAGDPADGSPDLGAAAFTTAGPPLLATINHAPSVDPGNSMTITDPSRTAQLGGSATDDGLPNGTLTLHWSQVSGPATAAFTDATKGFTPVVLPVDGVYVLRLTASDGALSTTGDVVLTMGVVAADTTAPTTPTGLAASPASSSQILLSWSASTDNVAVTGYKIFRNATLIGTSATPSFSDSGLTASTLYTYTVAAYDAAGNVSAFSDPSAVSTLPPASTGLGAHPRIWLSAQMLSELQSKISANDPTWPAVKSAADGWKNQLVPRVHIVSATNTNPVQFTTADPIPWYADTVTDLNMGGATGAWAAINTPNWPQWTATRTSPNTFTIPVDATSFGAFSGQDVSAISPNGEANTYICVGQSGDCWYEAFNSLGIAYKLTGDTSYRDRALELFDYVTDIANHGIYSVIAFDSGRGDMGSTLGLALGYDWFYDSLSASQKSAAVSAINFWNDWTTQNAYGINDPSTNYFGGHIQAVGASGYATSGDNPRAQEWIDWSRNRLDYYAPLFLPPAANSTNALQGEFYTGFMVIGYNYGPNDVVRILKSMQMVKTATGEDMFTTRDWAQRWSKNLLYNLRPDRWHSTNHGQYTGEWYGAMAHSAAIVLSYVLQGKPEGAWMAWMHNHPGPYPSGSEFLLTTTDPADDFLWERSGLPQTDYRVGLPTTYYSAGGSANVYWRSGWDDNADYAYFRAGNLLYTASVPKMAGHVDINRGADWLLVQSSFWKGLGDGSTGSPPEMDDTSGASANTLYFNDGTLANGGACWTGDVYNGCQLVNETYSPPKAKVTAAYAFGENNFSSNYQGNNNPSPSNLKYFLRNFTAMGDGVYVVQDRVRSANTSDIKQIRWHLSSLNAPSVSNGVIMSVVRNSQIFIKPLLPGSSPAIALNRNLNGSGTAVNWRAEVTDAMPAQNFHSITVLYTTAAGGSMPAADLLSSVDANFAGVQVGGAVPKVVVLPNSVTDLGNGQFASPSYNTTSFSSTFSGNGQIMVSGLTTGTYSINKDGNALLTNQVVGSDGTLYFTSASGSFNIFRTGAPPPPTINTFAAQPAVITPGSSSFLVWDSPDATSIAISPIGTTSNLPTGSVTVTPAATQTYTLTATGSGGTATRTVTVVVSSNPINPGPGPTSPPTNPQPGGNPPPVSVTPGQTLSVRVYPNPWRSDKHAGHASITFDGLVANTTIKLFTVSGHKVKELSTTQSKIDWDLTNNSGDKVASGIYLYVITDSAGDKVKGKVAVIR